MNLYYRITLLSDIESLYLYHRITQYIEWFYDSRQLQKQKYFRMRWGRGNNYFLCKTSQSFAFELFLKESAILTKHFCILVTAFQGWASLPADQPAYPPDFFLLCSVGFRFITAYLFNIVFYSLILANVSVYYSFFKHTGNTLCREYSVYITITIYWNYSTVRLPVWSAPGRWWQGSHHAQRSQRWRSDKVCGRPEGSHIGSESRCLF